jgi:hypothetical protein
MGAKLRVQEGKGEAGIWTVSARVSSLPPDIYLTLQDIAKQKKVSFAWVIRDAAEKYIAEQWPLLGRQGP